MLLEIWVSSAWLFEVVRAVCRERNDRFSESCISQISLPPSASLLAALFAATRRPFGCLSYVSRVVSLARCVWSKHALRQPDGRRCRTEIDGLNWRPPRKYTRTHRTRRSGRPSAINYKSVAWWQHDAGLEPEAILAPTADGDYGCCQLRRVTTDWRRWTATWHDKQSP